MKNKNTYFDRKSKNEDCFVDIFFKDDILNGQNFKKHWHEHMQIYYFVDGIALLECENRNFEVKAGSIAIINSNELHYLESHSDNLKFYTIRIEPTFLFSNQVDVLQTKYFSQIALNRISFQNLIQDDSRALHYVQMILQEYANKDIGYELAVKACIYQLIVLLLRDYVEKILTENEFQEKKRILTKFQSIFDLIERKYTDKLSLNELADCVHLSPNHFCRTFKLITGKTTTDYINGIRLDKAIFLLKQTDLNITEIAMKCGFDDMNYFSRLFKKYQGIPPTQYRKFHSD